MIDARDAPPDGSDLPAAGPERERFERWLGSAAVGALLDAVAYRDWRDTEITTIRRTCRSGRERASEVRIRYRLDRADVARVRAAAVAAIEAAGGRVELGSVVATVAAGELRISMA